MSSSRTFALILTLIVIGVVGFWAWTGLKSPPVREPASIITTPAGWVRVDTGQGFTFYTPEGMQFHRLPDANTRAGEIVGGAFYVHYALGRLPNTLINMTGDPDYSETPIVIDGRHGVLRRAVLRPEQQQARFGQYAQPYYMGIYIPQAIQGPDGQWLALDAEGVASDGDNLAGVQWIFKTIQFPRGR